MGRYSEQSVVIIVTSVLCAVGWLLTTFPTPSVVSIQFTSDRQLICYELNSATYRSLERSLDRAIPGVVVNQAGRPSGTRVDVFVTPAERRQVDAVVRKHDPAAGSKLILTN